MLIAEKIEETSSQFWQDELENSKILLNEIDKAILFLTKDLASSGGVQSYTLNTGQDSQTVTRADMSNLYSKRDSLIKNIQYLERLLGNNSARIITPFF